VILKLKLWLAERLGIRKLQQLVEYLVISNLNLSAGRDEGPAGNERLTRVFFDLVETLRPTVFCDIGANDGNTASAVKQRLTSCAVFAFEANPAIHAMYRDQPSLAQLRYLNLAVAERNAPVTIFAPLTLSRAYLGGEVVPAEITEAPNTGKTSLLKRNERASYHEFTVEGRTLDSLLQQEVGALPAPRIVLWIDVEGAADKVLAGALGVLRHTLAIFIETENFEFWQNQGRSADVARLLIAHGFVPVSRDREYGDKQFNTLFVSRQILPLVHGLLFDVGTGGLIPPMPVVPHPAPAPPTQVPRRFRTVGASLLSGAPVLIPAFNNESHVSGIIAQLRRHGLNNLIVVDNASTSASFRSYLDTLSGSVRIVSLSENRGPRDIVAAAVNFAALPEMFCVTDPDLLLNPQLPDDFLAELLSISEQHKVGKVGFALDISDRDLMRDDEYDIGGQTFKIWEWEAKYWKEQVGATRGGDPLFKAEIDTTFALYNKRYYRPEAQYDAIRVAGVYTCKHLPWYKDVGMTPAEEALYRSTQKFSYYLPGGPSRAGDGGGAG
jgi:FkbM family methyltransferase